MAEEQQADFSQGGTLVAEQPDFSAGGIPVGKPDFAPRGTPVQPSIGDRLSTAWDEWMGDMREAGQIIKRNAPILDAPLINPTDVQPTDLSPNPGMLAETGAGLNQAANALIRGVTSPLSGVAPVVAGGAIPALAKPIALGFLGWMAKNAPEALQSFVDETKAGNVAGAVSTGAQLAVGAALAPALGKESFELGKAAAERLRANNAPLTANVVQNTLSVPVKETPSLPVEFAPETPKSNENQVASAGALPSQFSESPNTNAKINAENGTPQPSGADRGQAKSPENDPMTGSDLLVKSKDKVEIKAKDADGNDLAIKMPADKAELRMVQRKTALETLMDCLAG